MARRRSREAGGLEAVGSALRAKVGTRVFEVSSDFPKDRMIVWGGGDLESFLRMAGDSDQGILYLHEETVEKGEGVPSKHAGDIWLTEVAFVRDGVFHVFRMIAPWAEELLTEKEESAGLEDQRAVKDLVSTIQKEGDSLVVDFLKQTEEEGRALEPSGWELRRGFTDFLRQRIELPEDLEFFTLRHSYPDLNRLINKLVERAGGEIRSKERKVLESLVSQCAEWARRNTVKTLNQGDVEVFLDEENIPLSKESRRLLWQKANFALKTSRVPS